MPRNTVTSYPLTAMIDELNIRRVRPHRNIVGGRSKIDTLIDSVNKLHCFNADQSHEFCIIVTQFTMRAAPMSEMPIAENVYDEVDGYRFAFRLPAGVDKPLLLQVIKAEATLSLEKMQINVMLINHMADRNYSPYCDEAGQAMDAFGLAVANFFMCLATAARAAGKPLPM